MIQNEEKKCINSTNSISKKPRLSEENSNLQQGNQVASSKLESQNTEEEIEIDFEKMNSKC